jgi:hypothetical protein
MVPGAIWVNHSDGSLLTELREVSKGRGGTGGRRGNLASGSQLEGREGRRMEGEENGWRREGEGRKLPSNNWPWSC